MTKRKKEGCLKCGHQWTPKAKHKPLSCPKCKNYSYDQERVVRESKPVEKDPDSTVGVPWVSPPKEERW